MNARHDTDLDHPTESELAELALGRLDEARSSSVVGHLRSCLACRILSDRLSQGVPTLPVGDPPGGSNASVPEAVLAAVVAADRPEAGAQPGDLWRARHGRGGPVTLVWLRALGPTGVAVVPVTFDIELADEYTLIVPAATSPLAIPLAFHVSVETTVDAAYLLDRLGSVDIAATLELVRVARERGEPVRGPSVGPGIVSPLDERVEYREALADRLAELAPAAEDGLPPGARDMTERQAAERDDWWLPAPGSGRAALLMALHEALGGTHARARVTPRPAIAAASEHFDAIALVAELDAFVLIASVEGPLEGRALLESARLALQADQLLNAVCLVEPFAPFMSAVIDRRDVVEAIEVPSGRLRPPRQSRPLAPIGEAVAKFLDATISPFGRLAGTVVDGEAIDPRGLATDVSAQAVRTVAGSARGFKVDGKRPGYERVTRHKASITRLVESALGDPDVDVASIMEIGE